jgi:outer membrane protein assembly factor BamD (BamD/ComL family)
LIKKGESEKATIALEDIIRDFPKTDFSAQAYYKLSQLSLIEYGDFANAYEYIDLANKEFSRSTMRDSILFWINNLKAWDKLNFELAVYKQAFVNLDISSDDTIGNYIVEESENPEDEFEFPDIFANQDSAKTRADSLRQIAIRDSVRADSLRNLTGVQDDPRRQNQQNLNQEQAPNRRNRNLSLANNPQANAKNQKSQKVLKKVTVPKSPAKLKSNLVASGNRLAELFFLEFNFPDSALAYYDFLLTEFPEHEMNQHWLFTSSFLLSKMGFQDQADSIKNYIIEVYPESDYAIQLRQQLQLDEIEQEINPASELFNQAEKYLFEKEMVDSSIYIYQKIIDDYPESELAPKSLYSIAYIYDWFKNDTSQALGRYRQLVSDYPGSDYAKESQKKISAVQKFIKQTEMEKKKQEIADSLKTVQGDSTMVDEVGRQQNPPKNQLVEDERTGKKITRSQVQADTSEIDKEMIRTASEQSNLKKRLPSQKIESLEEKATGKKLNSIKIKNDTLKTGKKENSIIDTLKVKVKKIPPPPENKKK